MVRQLPRVQTGNIMAIEISPSSSEYWISAHDKSSCENVAS